MKFLYGYDQEHYVDISNKVFDKCLTDTQIYIPSDDNVRCSIFGDPFLGIVKHILIIDSAGIEHKFSHNKDITISFESISNQLIKESIPKKWINLDYANPVDKLSKIQSRLDITYGTFVDEYPEQLLATTFINKDNKVLELGGNIGRNTMIIAMILNDAKDLVTLECDGDIAQQLKYNIESNGLDCHIVNAALSHIQLVQRGWETKPLLNNVIPDGWKEVPTISFENLVKKYKVKFDTLVADCEGALYYILRDDPDMLNDINLIILENDFSDVSHKMAVDKIFEIKGFKCIQRDKGIPAAAWSPCYEYFYEVWKKI